MISFEEDLQQLINRHSAESVSGTPDYLLAKLLLETLKTFNDVVTLRADWRGESTELPALIPEDCTCTNPHQAHHPRLIKPVEVQH